MLFSWTAVTSDLDDEDLAKEPLQHIVELWVSIRGFSAAGAWMEYYKQHIEITTTVEPQSYEPLGKRVCSQV